jgi:1,2-diacylglycerol 3-beta-galactosyltransferase
MTAAFAPRAVERSPLVDLVFFDAGGGHRATATALAAELARVRPRWRVRLLNLRDLLDSIDVLRRVTRLRAEDLYNGVLRHGLTATVGPMIPLLHLLVRRTHLLQVAKLARFWLEPRPDLVVSLIPHFNRAIGESLRAVSSRTHRSTPLVTVLTDLADYPPNFWIEEQEQYLVCGTARATAQALASGHSRDRVFQTSGLVVRPEFYRPLRIPRAEARLRLGLDPDLPTGLVLFGGFGSHRMITVARQLSKLSSGTQLIFLCGHNRRLRRRIAAMNLPFPHHVEGFTRRVPYFMQLADYLIGKPGPGSISEAMVTGLPVVVERNRRTMVHERYNTDWILENGVGVVLRSFAEIGAGIAPMLDAERLTRFRTRVAQLGNRAVFEVPRILDEVMARTAPSWSSRVRLGNVHPREPLDLVEPPVRQVSTRPSRFTDRWA